MSKYALDVPALQAKLHQYCLHVTGERWEAEDLLQETMIKVMRAVEIKPDRPITNAYLYRIASNAWKDRLRKEKSVKSVTDEELKDRPGEDGGLSTRELLETLADRLSPRAIVILLLMDVLDFTAGETADFLSMSEGTVQVSLGRARARLRKLHQLQQAGIEAKPEVRTHADAAEGLDMDALVDAFRRRDPKAICASYLQLTKLRIRISRLRRVRGSLAFYMEDPDGNVWMITE
ncbi:MULTISPECIES: RNA polymerase sigma factor [Paenibacillus]|uniref:RNA polymerase sigma factor n=1 Tax=Paenibacillus TaxID=44249 RepID=UPI0004BC82B4|nr:RNA polymerase sigma factor [Paenibacillus lactis]MCM3492964.1 RNA polymerase sigma factor [Paenibacillus lactis]